MFFVVSILLCYKLTFSGPASSASSPRTGPGWSAWRSRAAGRLWGPSTELLYPRRVKHVNGLVATYIPGNRLLLLLLLWFTCIKARGGRERKGNKTIGRKSPPLFGGPWSNLVVVEEEGTKTEGGGGRREKGEKVSSSLRGESK